MLDIRRPLTSATVHLFMSELPIDKINKQWAAAPTLFLPRALALFVNGLIKAKVPNEAQLLFWWSTHCCAAKQGNVVVET